MRITVNLTSLAAPLLLGACVTINVYFPAAAAEKAADRFIEEVWGPREAAPAGAPAPAKEPTSRLDATPGAGLAARLLDWLVPAAQAQQADLEISTPAVKKIEASMRGRHRKLEAHYASGAVGLTDDGLIAVRDPKAVPIAQRRGLNELVADDNRDRKALYAEVARANGHPEWEADIRKTFARRWIGKAHTGWWIEAPGGWRQK